MDPLELKKRLMGLTGDDVDSLIGSLCFDLERYPTRPVSEALRFAIETVDDLRSRTAAASS